MIRNIDLKRNEALFETEPVHVASSPRKDELVFNRYGDSYFLSEVVTGGEETARS
jgi:hypothetical protein